jgi:hypothetical protein
LTDAPIGDVGSNRDNVARRFVTQDAVSVVHLGHLSGVKIAPADPAQLYFNDDLVRSQGRTRAVREGYLAFGG